MSSKSGKTAREQAGDAAVRERTGRDWAGRLNLMEAGLDRTRVQAQVTSFKSFWSDALDRLAAKYS